MDGLSLRKNHYRTIWISDVHLGTSGCKAELLLEFLKVSESEKVFLIGDIVDGWRLKKKWYWPQAHNDVIQKLLRKARKGVKVVFIPGNHDEAARKYIGVNFGDIIIKKEAHHTTLKGKKLWIIHGDQFDSIIKHARWLAYLGDKGYVILIRLNDLFNNFRQFLKLPYWSLSKFIKQKVKKAVSFVTAFELVMIREAKRRGFDGVVCGHIHKAEFKSIDDMIYCNSGDWVESMTAIVEHLDGSLEIVDWSSRISQKHSRQIKLTQKNIISQP